MVRALSKEIGMHFFVLDHAVDIMFHSYKNTPVSEAEDSYPIIILSQGWQGFRNIHSDLAKELASQGYIVIGIEDTYGSVGTVMDDETMYLDEDALPKREITTDFLEYANELVFTYAGDIPATIDFPESIEGSNHAANISGAMDLTTIGLLGHTTGGGAGVTD